MDSADGLFVYGSLREGGLNRAWLLRTHPEGMTLARMAGRLFHLPAGYPAMVAGAEPAGPQEPGWIHGEFVGYEDQQDLAAALEDLDALEGVDEGLFSREIRPVVLAGGQRYLAWTYLFHVERLPRLEREAVEVTTGDWAPYLHLGLT